MNMQSAGKRRCTSETPQLPLDLVLEIAARSDPTTLVRCAATSKVVHRRVVDRRFLGSLRLRHGDVFVPSLLLGHLFWKSARDLYLVDNDMQRATELLSDNPLTKILWQKVLAARDGLLLIRSIDVDEISKGQKLRVCRPTTGRSQVVPHQRYEGQYVLLVGDDGDGALGRRFRVVKVTSPTSVSSNLAKCRLLQFQIFFSEQGRWGRRVRVPIPCVHGDWLQQKPLISNGALHWLCRSDKLYYIIKLHVDSAKVTTMKLPVSFHHEHCTVTAVRKQLLLAKQSGSHRLCVVTAGSEKISVWVQSECDSSSWARQPEMDIEYEAMTWLGRRGLLARETVRLEWFSDRSGFVLFDAVGHGSFILDIRSKEILRWPSGPADFGGRSDVNIPYEMDLTCWVPKFNNTL